MPDSQYRSLMPCSCDLNLLVNGVNEKYSLSILHIEDTMIHWTEDQNYL